MLAITPHLLLTAPTETTSVLSPSLPIEDKVKKLFAEYTATVSQERKVLTENVNNIAQVTQPNYCNFKIVSAIIA